MKSSEDLIHDIQRKDQIWHTFVTFMIIIFLLGISTIIYLNYQTNLRTATIITNLQQAVTDLKADSAANTATIARQNREIECLLALHGADVPIDASVEAQCKKMAQNIDVGDVSKAPAANQNTPTPQTTGNPGNSQTNAPQAPNPPGAVKGLVNAVNNILKRVGL